MQHGEQAMSLAAELNATVTEYVGLQKFLICATKGKNKKQEKIRT